MLSFLSQGNSLYSGNRCSRVNASWVESAYAWADQVFAGVIRLVFGISAASGVDQVPSEQAR